MVVFSFYEINSCLCRRATCMVVMNSVRVLVFLSLKFWKKKSELKNLIKLNCQKSLEIFAALYCQYCQLRLWLCHSKLKGRIKNADQLISNFIYLLKS